MINSGTSNTPDVSKIETGYNSAVENVNNNNSSSPEYIRLFKSQGCSVHDEFNFKNKMYKLLESVKNYIGGLEVITENHIKSESDKVKKTRLSIAHLEHSDRGNKILINGPDNFNMSIITTGQIGHKPASFGAYMSEHFNLPAGCAKLIEYNKACDNNNDQIDGYMYGFSISSVVSADGSSERAYAINLHNSYLDMDWHIPLKAKTYPGNRVQLTGSCPLKKSVREKSGNMNILFHGTLDVAILANKSSLSSPETFLNQIPGYKTKNFKLVETKVHEARYNLPDRDSPIIENSEEYSITIYTESGQATQFSTSYYVFQNFVGPLMKLFPVGDAILKSLVFLNLGISSYSDEVFREMQEQKVIDVSKTNPDAYNEYCQCSKCGYAFKYAEYMFGKA